MHICLTRPPWVNSSSKLSIHWDWVTHVCVRKLPMIDSDNGLSPVQYLAIIWTNAVLLLIGRDRRQAQDQHPYWHPCSSSLGTYKNSTQGNTAREPHHGLVNRALQKLTVVEEIVAGWPVPASDENLDCSEGLYGNGGRHTSSVLALPTFWVTWPQMDSYWLMDTQQAS